jgi:SAM-dependent methyltransferase
VTPECPACGEANARTSLAFSATDRALHTTTKVFPLFRCGECGSYFQHPMPSSSEIASFYPDSYSSFDMPELAVTDAARAILGGQLTVRDISRLRGAGLDSRLAMLASAGPADRRFPRVLDVGAGSGHFLAGVQRVFSTDFMLAVDVSERAVERCVARGIPARVGGVEVVTERDFDLVIVNHTIEHVPNPRGLIAAVADRLRGGGYLLLSLPDVDSVYRRLLGHRWGGFEVPRHLVSFSRSGIERLLRQQFQIVHRFSDRFFMSNFAQFCETGLRRRIFWHRASLAVWRAMERVTTALDAGDQQVLLCRKTS